MILTINGAPITLDFDTILIWVLVGLVAGFLASHLALGRGLGLFGDIGVGILGAFIGGFLAAVFHISIAVVGHPIISAMFTCEASTFGQLEKRTKVMLTASNARAGAGPALIPGSGT